MLKRIGLNKNAIYLYNIFLFEYSLITINYNLSVIYSI
jgi:hypothetical protein